MDRAPDRQGRMLWVRSGAALGLALGLALALPPPGALSALTPSDGQPAAGDGAAIGVGFDAGASWGQARRRRVLAQGGLCPPEAPHAAAQAQPLDLAPRAALVALDRTARPLTPPE